MSFPSSPKRARADSLCVDVETPAATIERLQTELAITRRHKMRYRKMVCDCVECAMCHEAWAEADKTMVIRECGYCEDTFCAPCLAPCALCSEVVCAKCGPCECTHDAKVDAKLSGV